MYKTKTPMFVSSEDHHRACHALRRDCERKGFIYSQPTQALTAWVDATTLELSNCNGQLARVRVDRAGRMRVVA